MKKALFVLLLAGVPLVALGQSVIIGDYGTGEFAVKGTIEQQLAKEVVAPISAALSRNPQSRIVLDIIGYTDNVGEPSLNDHLGLDRAEQVKIYLARTFRNAEFRVSTGGAERNRRMVVVQVHWEAVKTQSYTAPTRSFAKPIIFLLGILIVAATVVALSLKKKRILRSADSQEELVKYVGVAKDGSVLYVPITRILKDNATFYGTPFHNKQTKTRIFRKNERKAEVSIVGYVEDPVNAPIVQSLVERGVIKTANPKEMIQ